MALASVLICRVAASAQSEPASQAAPEPSAAPLAAPDEAAGRYLLRMARESYDRGVQKHDVSALTWSLDALRLAFVLWPEPELLHNMGQAARHLGRCGEARHFYARYLAQQRDPQRRSVAEHQLAALDECAEVEPAPLLLVRTPAPGASEQVVPEPHPPAPSAAETAQLERERRPLSYAVSAKPLRKRAIVTGTLASASVLALVAAIVSFAQLRSAANDVQQASRYEPDLESAQQAGEAAQRRVWIFAPLAVGLGTSALLTRLLMDPE